ncbi:MAG: hypothetical protein ABEJ70_05260 [Halobacteriaceae archaeon]
MDAETVLDRATVTHAEPPLYGLQRPVWVAEDAETGCSGLGHVEAQARGNLVAAVERYAAVGGTGDPFVAFPGRRVRKTWAEDASDGRRGVLERAAALLHRVAP